jgi:hypothetical protein
MFCVVALSISEAELLACLMLTASEANVHYLYAINKSFSSLTVIVYD